MNAEVLIPFAKHSPSGRMVSIDDVSAGLSCECECLFCKVPMVAKKGDIKVHHFAHKPKDTDEDLVCKFSLERAIYWMIQEIYSEIEVLMLPECKISKSPEDLPKSFEAILQGSSSYPVFDTQFPLPKGDSEHEVAIVNGDDGSSLLIVYTFNMDELDCYELLSFYTLNASILIVDLKPVLSKFKSVQNGFRVMLKDFIFNLENISWYKHIDAEEVSENLNQQEREYRNSMKSSASLDIAQSRKPFQGLQQSKINTKIRMDRDSLDKRLDDLIESAMSIREAGNEEGLLCEQCLYMSGPEEHICKYCSESNFRMVKLDNSYFSSIRNKYHSWNYAERSISQLKG